MFKVVVTHGAEEPMINTKAIYEAANALFIAECRNAAGYLATKPADPVTVQLIKPDGGIDKTVSIVALRESAGTKPVQLEIFNHKK